MKMIITAMKMIIMPTTVIMTMMFMPVIIIRIVGALITVMFITVHTGTLGLVFTIIIRTIQTVIGEAILLGAGDLDTEAIIIIGVLV